MHNISSVYGCQVGVNGLKGESSSQSIKLKIFSRGTKAILIGFKNYFNNTLGNILKKYTINLPTLFLQNIGSHLLQVGNILHLFTKICFVILSGNQYLTNVGRKVHLKTSCLHFLHNACLQMTLCSTSLCLILL